MNIKRIELAEPLWRKRALALDISNEDASTILEVSVNYVYQSGIRKGLKPYPDLLYIRVGRAMKTGRNIYTKEGKQKEVPLSEFTLTATEAEQKP